MAEVIRIAPGLGAKDLVILNLSGRGDKDVQTVAAASPVARHFSNFKTMSRITSKFQQLKQEGKKAFIPFITLGDPDFETTRQMVLGAGGCRGGLD